MLRKLPKQVIFPCFPSFVKSMGIHWHPETLKTSEPVGVANLATRAAQPPDNADRNLYRYVGSLTRQVTYTEKTESF